MAWRRKVKAVLTVGAGRINFKMVLMSSDRKYLPRRRVRSAVWPCIVAFAGLTACSSVTDQGINDPFEKENRSTFELNRNVDRTIIRPIAEDASKIIPEPVKQGVANFADNLDVPTSVVNDLLQAKVGKAVGNTLRFAVNTTIGIGGLFDPATKLGLPGTPTDFGETLHVWGVSEGAYLVLPVLGPSTRRDALGKVVDYALDPLRLVIPKNKAYIGTLAKVGAKIRDRGRYFETIDSILYDSADGYAQSRLLYLEHRRYNLGQATTDSTFEDPYAK